MAIPQKSSKDLGKCLRDVMQMLRSCEIHFETYSAGAATVALCGLLLTACMHAAPPMLTDRTAVISGRETSGFTPNDATQIVLVKAAAMTLDHGFRYFQIMGADSVGSDRGGNELIRPGVNVTIKVYRAGDINPRATGIVDAQDIAEHMQARIVSVSAPAKGSTPSTPAQPNANSGMPSPHCTVYGCTW